ncbi:hypothetical protein T492DRAFT_892227 [Pavlovales sp. CCMP2436]|nr:hypothetical protein T492DRAFT_892227 [Pavlovales sp. CCMP2436]
MPRPLEGTRTMPHLSATPGEGSPRGLLRLLLEVRDLAASICAWLERVGAALESLDCRVARLERGTPPPPPADAPPPPMQPAGGADGGAMPAAQLSASATTLDDLPAELLALVAGALPLDGELAASLACRKLHAAVVCTRERDGRAGSRTSGELALDSVGKLEFALSCGLPLTAWLCAQAAGRGLLPQLAWLRAHGCPWDASSCTAAAEGVGTRQRLQPITRATLHAPMGASGTLSPAPLLHGVGMDWARANGCNWDEQTILAAERVEAVVEWLRANGCPEGEEGDGWESESEWEEDDVWEEVGEEGGEAVEEELVAKYHRLIAGMLRVKGKWLHCNIRMNKLGQRLDAISATMHARDADRRAARLTDCWDASTSTALPRADGSRNANIQAIKKAKAINRIELRALRELRLIKLRH